MLAWSEAICWGVSVSVDAAAAGAAARRTGPVPVLPAPVPVLPVKSPPVSVASAWLLCVGAEPELPGCRAAGARAGAAPNRCRARSRMTRRRAPGPEPSRPSTPSLVLGDLLLVG